MSFLIKKDECSSQQLSPESWVLWFSWDFLFIPMTSGILWFSIQLVEWASVQLYTAGFTRSFKITTLRTEMKVSRERDISFNDKTEETWWVRSVVSWERFNIANHCGKQEQLDNTDYVGTYHILKSKKVVHYLKI